MNLEQYYLNISNIWPDQRYPKVNQINMKMDPTNHGVSTLCT